MAMRTYSAKIRIRPSLKITFFDTCMIVSLDLIKTTRITNAGITMELNTALPAVVPIPPENPVVSRKRNR